MNLWSTSWRYRRAVIYVDFLWLLPNSCTPALNSQAGPLNFHLHLTPSPPFHFTCGPEANPSPSFANHLPQQSELLSLSLFGDTICLVLSSLNFPQLRITRWSSIVILASIYLYVNLNLTS